MEAPKEAPIKVPIEAASEPPHTGKYIYGVIIRNRNIHLWINVDKKRPEQEAWIGKTEVERYEPDAEIVWLLYYIW